MIFIFKQSKLYFSIQDMHASDVVYPVKGLYFPTAHFLQVDWPSKS